MKAIKNLSKDNQNSILNRSKNNFALKAQVGAIDDLKKSDEGSDELGSGHIGNTELTSGLFYGYVVVDVDLLLSNLTGQPASELAPEDRELGARVVESLIHLIATVSPGAKLGSTAPYSRAHCVLVEASNSQPRTLANAFLRPVRANGDLIANTYRAIAKFHSEEREMYGDEQERALSAMGNEREALADAMKTELRPVRALASWAGQQVRQP